MKKKQREEKRKVKIYDSLAPYGVTVWHGAYILWIGHRIWSIAFMGFMSSHDRKLLQQYTVVIAWHKGLLA